MSLQGWSHPQSPTGESALVPPPPWHFSGELLGVDFGCEYDVMVELLPAPLQSRVGGHCSMVFASWSSAADLDPRMGADPGKGQYREAYVVMAADLDERKVARVPYAWVDSDMSLVRGHAQGYPKKYGSIAVSTAVAVGRGGPRREAGATFAGHLSSIGRRLATASVRLTEEADYIPPALDRDLWHTRLMSDLAGGPPLVRDLARDVVVDFEIANHWRGEEATLEFGSSEFDEIDRLAPVEVIGGWVCSVAFTVTGAEIRAME